MDPHRWQRLKSILNEAFEQESTSARLAFVERSCSGDEALLQDAESLLAEAESLRRSAYDDLEACAENAEQRIRRSETVSHIGKRIGAYSVTREIGRGGMGMVYLAARADGYFQKQVAIKVLKPGAETEEMLRRFYSERQVLARLDHPNIARLLDAGSTEDGSQYFVMEYVEGIPVTRFLEDRNAPVPVRLDLFLKICSAVEAAHANSVVHRDLKPSNILVTEKGDVKLLDFGIAKVMLAPVDDIRADAPTSELFTPVSAAPEQARGETVSELTDVYALGVLLYEILSGRKPHRFPHRNPTFEELLTVLCEQEPHPPSFAVDDRSRQRELRGDLDAIVRCALQKNPAKRYASVKCLADDVRRHLAGEPVRVRSTERAYVFRRSIAARPLTLAFASLAVACALSLLLLSGRVFLNRKRYEPAAGVTPPGNAIAVLIFRTLTPGTAVLPFEGPGSNTDDSCFADGIHDDIRAGLTRQSTFKVIGRNSVAAYRDAGNGRAIAEALGAAYILEGSVQRLSERLRVNARLIDARSETTSWEHHFDEPIEALVSIESEIVDAVSTHMGAPLSAADKRDLATRPTPDPAAYLSYLRALHAFNQPDYSRAIDFLNDAIARDPRFLRAYCLLSKTQIQLYRFVYPSEESLAAAKAAAVTALRLAPESGEAHLAMARVHRASRDFGEALQELLKVDLPRDKAELSELLALAERRKGRWKDALRHGQLAVELDPHNAFVTLELLETYIALRQFTEAEDFASRVMKRFPPDDDVLAVYLSSCHLGFGNLAAARSVLATAPVRTVWGTERLIQLAIFARDVDRASALIATLPAEKKYSRLWLGTVAAMRGETEKARDYYIGAVRYYEKARAEHPDDLDARTSLSLTYAALKRKEQAISEAQLAFESVPLSRDAVDAPVQMVALAEVYAQVGERNAALELLAQAVELPAGPNYGELKFDPIWDDLRADPRFMEIMSRAAKRPRWD